MYAKTFAYFALAVRHSISRNVGMCYFNERILENYGFFVLFALLHPSRGYILGNAKDTPSKLFQLTPVLPQPKVFDYNSPQSTHLLFFLLIEKHSPTNSPLVLSIC